MPRRFGRRLHALRVVRAEARFFRCDVPSPMADLPTLAETDPDLDRITGEEERTPGQGHRAPRVSACKSSRARPRDYDAQLLDLRDQIATARMEDVPPLLEQMERLHILSTRKREATEVHVDAKSPYFGHLALEENGKRRDVLIGRGTYLDSTVRDPHRRLARRARQPLVLPLRRRRRLRRGVRRPRSIRARSSRAAA